MHRHDGDLWLPPAPSSYRKRGIPTSPLTVTEGAEEACPWVEGGGERGETGEGGFRSVSAEISLFFFFLVNDGRAATMTDRGCLTSFRKKKEKERKAQIDPDYSHKVSRYYKTTSEGDDAHTNASPSSRRELHI